MRRQTAKTRIDMRITPQRKYYFELAAFIGGYDNLTSFMSDASEKLAHNILNKSEKRELSDIDRDLLMNFLKRAPEPNTSLSAAFERVSKMYDLDEEADAIYKVANKLVKNLSNQ